MNQSGVELLINGTARQSKGVVAQITAACARNDIRLDTVHVLRGDALDQGLLDIKNRNPKLLIVGGGDGTVSHAMGMLANSSVEVGIVPLGTTNNFARSLALPLSIEEAVRVIAIGKVAVIDLGKIDTQYFANVAGIGLSAAIAESVSDTAKQRFGRFAYALQGIKQLITHRPFEVTIQDKDKELRTYFETHQVIVANGRYHAGKEIALDASLASHELIIFALGGKSRLSLLLHMLDFYIGPRKKIRHASYLVGNNVLISTNTPQPVEVDGEVTLATPLEVSVDIGAMKVRVA